MEKKALIAAIASALLGGLLLEVYLRRFESEACGGDKVAVLVLAEDLAAGDTLTVAALAARNLPQAYVETRHVREHDRDRVLGMQLAAAQHAGDALLWTDIAGMSARRRALSALIRDGARALTVRTQGGAFAGLLEPGDRVDAMVATTSHDDDSLGPPGGTVIENLVVLAVGTRVEVRTESDDKKGSGDGTDVTLSVTVEQARALAAAERGRPVRLLLRNPDDIVTRHGEPRAEDGQGQRR